MRLVYKHFPLTDVHPQAMNAALASSCAYFLGEEDIFFKYHDILFERVGEWKNDEARFVDYAKGLGLDTKQFTGCMKSDGAIRWVNKDIEEGKQWDVDRVPTLFVNEKMIVGAQPFEFFAQLIEEEAKR